jgi:hypothetical protein
MKMYCLLLVTLCTIAPALAQEPPQPGAEHKFLAELAGDWDVTLDVEGGAMKGETKYKMIHGGLWLQSTLEMDMGGTKFTGQGLDSYDPVRKKYIGIWIDSMSTSPIMLEGERTKDGKTLSMTGKGPDQAGKIVDYKTETEYVSKDKHVFKMWMGKTTGNETMKATYTRRAAK